MAEVATDSDFFDVAKVLEPDDLQHFYVKLGLNHRDVSHAEASAGTTDTQLKAVAVLRKWKQTNGKKAKRQAIFQALQACDFLDAREELQAKWSCAGASPLMPTDNFNLEECQKQLKDFYLGPATEIQLLPWDPDHRVNMEAIFVNLELMKQEVSPSQTKSIPIKKNEDLVTFETSCGSKVNRILILGDGGCGKSTLLANLAHIWALDMNNPLSPLSRFVLVFLLNIHEIRNRKDSLDNIIFSHILEKSQGVSASSLKSYMKSHLENCLFLIDGLDEDHLGIFNDKSTEICEVLSNKIFKKSCVIVTTRAYKLKEMGNIQSQYTKAKLSGFSEENIELYIQKYFPTDENHGKELTKTLKTNPALLNLAATPILLLFLCLLWDDPDPSKRSLPSTKTKLYKATIESLWKRYHFVKLGVSEDALDGDNLLLNLENLLASLGQVTLKCIASDESLETDKILFRECDFKENDVLLALKFGILNWGRTRSKLHTETHVKFLHSSIQDYCSAIHLARLHVENTLEFKSYVGKLLTPPSNQCDVFEFCAGTSSDTVKLITEQLIVHMHSSDNSFEQGRIHRLISSPVLGSFSLVSESNQERKDNIAEMQATFKSRYTNVRLYHAMDLNFLFSLIFEGQLDHSKCSELVQVLSKASFSNFSIAWISDVLATYIQYQLDLLQPIHSIDTGLLFSTIRLIRLDMQPIEFPKFMPTIVSMLKYTKQVDTFFLLFSFFLPPNEVGNIDALVTALSNLKNLKLLRLFRIRDSESKAESGIVKPPGLVNISKSLHKLTNLHTLSLKDVRCNSLTFARFLSLNTSLEAIEVLGTNEENTITRVSKMYRVIKAMSRCKHLSILILKTVKIGGAVKYIQPIIPQLYELQLRSCNLGVWDMHILASFLGTAKKLKVLDLSHNFLDTAVNTLADQLKHMANLQNLNLDNTGLGDSHACILMQGVKKMSPPCDIFLTNNPVIGEVGREAINSVKCLPHLQGIDIVIEPISLINLVSTFYNLLRWNEQAELPDLPDCRCCMSFIYHSVQCRQCNQ